MLICSGCQVFIQQDSCLGFDPGPKGIFAPRFHARCCLMFGTDSDVCYWSQTFSLEKENPVSFIEKIGIIMILIIISAEESPEPHPELFGSMHAQQLPWRKHVCETPWNASL